MFFIGQEHIMSQLGDILMYTYKTKQGVNLLFRGASGYGKTEISKRCCNLLVGMDYEFCLGNNLRFNKNMWVHFIDEVHLLEHPEVLYPIMDSGIYVMIFATNFDSVLPEALVNRCSSFIFTEYTDHDLIDIFNYHSRDKFKTPFSDNAIKYIIDISGRNPRVMIKTFLDSIYKYCYNKNINLAEKSDQEVISKINEIFGIVNGLDAVSRHYLDTLKELGGRSSINLLASSMKLDINTIKYTVEPALLYKKLVKITSKGRELCQ